MFKKNYLIIATLSILSNINNFYAVDVDNLTDFRKPISSPLSTLDAESPFNVLVFEGGAVRVIIQKVILYWVKLNTGKEPYELFDLFVGSSAGAACALQLSTRTPDGKLRNSIKQSILSHQRDSAKGFSKPTISRQLITGFGLISPKYSTASLVKMCEDLSEDCRISETLVPVVFPIFDRRTKQVRWLSTMKAKAKPETEDFLIKEAAAAALAFPGFFRPVRMQLKTKSDQPKKYLLASDAGPFIYHPGPVAIVEARKMVEARAYDRTATVLKQIAGNNSLSEQEKVDLLKKANRLENIIKTLDIGSGIPATWENPKSVEAAGQAFGDGILPNIKTIVSQMFQGLGLNARQGIEAFYGDAAAENYCRLQVLLTKRENKKYPFVMDDTDPDVINELISQTVAYTKTKEFEIAMRKYFGKQLGEKLIPLDEEELLTKTKSVSKQEKIKAKL